MRTLQSELKKKGFANVEKPRPQSVKNEVKVKRNENLSNKDLRELMGEFRPTFARKKGGAFRQR